MIISTDIFLISHFQTPRLKQLLLLHADAVAALRTRVVIAAQQLGEGRADTASAVTASDPAAVALWQRVSHALATPTVTASEGLAPAALATTLASTWPSPTLTVGAAADGSSHGAVMHALSLIVSAGAALELRGRPLSCATGSAIGSTAAAGASLVPMPLVLRSRASGAFFTLSLTGSASGGLQQQQGGIWGGAAGWQACVRALAVAAALAAAPAVTVRALSALTTQTPPTMSMAPASRYNDAAKTAK